MVSRFLCSFVFVISTASIVLAVDPNSPLLGLKAPEASYPQVLSLRVLNKIQLHSEDGLSESGREQEEKSKINEEERLVQAQWKKTLAWNEVLKTSKKEDLEKLRVSFVQQIQTLVNEYYQLKEANTLIVRKILNFNKNKTALEEQKKIRQCFQNLLFDKTEVNKEITELLSNLRRLEFLLGKPISDFNRFFDPYGRNLAR